MRQGRKLLAALVSAGLLSGIFSATSQAATAADYRTTEYEKMGALDLVQAAGAYAKGYSGKGVYLGILDTTVR